MAYDIHFQPVEAESARGTRAFTFGFKATLKVKGPQALVNRWVKTFMTPKGSNPLDKSEGTAFGRLVGANSSILGHGGVEDVVVLALEDANDQVRAQDLDGMFPEEERLANATLLNIQTLPSRDGIEVWVHITNAAGRVLPVKLVALADR